MYKKALIITGLIIALGCHFATNKAFADTQEVDLGIYTPQFMLIDARIKKEPKEMNHYLNKADLHLRFYQLAEANVLFKEALTLADNERIKNYLEAVILYTDLKLDDAIKKLDENAENSDKCKKTTFLRGLIALQKADTDKALDYFEKALELDNNYLEAMNQIGWIYLAKADYDKAIECFNQILYRDNHYMSAVDGKGYALFKLGLNKEALPYINDVIILTPDNWGAWVSKGEIYFSEGEYYLAGYCLSKASEINPDALPVMLLKEKLTPITPVKADKSTTQKMPECQKGKEIKKPECPKGKKENCKKMKPECPKGKKEKGKKMKPDCPMAKTETKN